MCSIKKVPIRKSLETYIMILVYILDGGDESLFARTVIRS